MRKLSPTGDDWRDRAGRSSSTGCEATDSGVLCNQYADAVATAFLPRTAQEDAHLQPRDTERHGATMVRYVLRAGGLAEPSGGWLGVPADRRPRGVALARLAEWSVLKLGGYDQTAVSWQLPEGLRLDQTLLIGGFPPPSTKVNRPARDS